VAFSTPAGLSSSSSQVHGSRWPSQLLLSLQYLSCLHTLTEQVLLQYPRIWDMHRGWQLNDTTYSFIWRQMSFGDFISASAYQVMFIDRSLLLGAKQLWRCSHLANAASLNDWSLLDFQPNHTAWSAWFNLQALVPQQQEVFASCWLRAMKQVHKQQRKGFIFLAWLVTWSL
jgi:hypothetical protein